MQVFAYDKVSFCKRTKRKPFHHHAQKKNRTKFLVNKTEQNMLILITSLPMLMALATHGMTHIYHPNTEKTEIKADK